MDAMQCYIDFAMKNTEKEIDEEKERETKTLCIISVKFQFRKQIAHIELSRITFKLCTISCGYWICR